MKLNNTSGENSRVAKVTKEQVEEIRNSTKDRETLAAIYGLSKKQITNIRRKKAWRSLS